MRGFFYETLVLKLTFKRLSTGLEPTIFAISNLYSIMKKYVVLSILFILPITAYIFFSMSTSFFKSLPVLTDEVAEISKFRNLEDKEVQLEGHITILGFFGSDLEANRAYAYNLAHKIYGKNHKFDDFQFVILLPNGTEEKASDIEEKIKQVAPTDSWHFAFGEDQDIRKVFESLQAPYTLDANLATPYVFIIDKERSLRGRDDDEQLGVMKGFNSSIIAEINNKMDDDVKVLLAEYRRALKKYQSQREI